MKIIDLKSTNISLNKDNINISNKKAFDKLMFANSKEWYNTVYNFNNKNIRHLPIFDNLIIKLIKSYFNMYNDILHKKIKLKNLPKIKRDRLGNKTWVSRAELKHTNDKVIVNIYVYDRKSNYILKKLKNILYFESKQKIKDLLKIPTIKNNKIYEAINIYYLNKISDKSKVLAKKYFYNSKLKEIINIYLYKLYLSNYIKKVLKKKFRILYYKQYILFNNLRFKNMYIIPLKKLISKIYKKKIIFNIVNLKNYFLNSDILTQIISNKAINRKNKIVKILRIGLRKVKIPNFSKNLTSKVVKNINIENNILLKNKIELNQKNDSINKVLEDIFYNKESESLVINSLKNRIVTGIRIEASGRLTKRFTAQRSIFKYKYKGTIKNVNSSYKGLSSKNLRNNLESNLQYTKINSNNRIGAFGIKGWISSI